jgi:hypothetical protein
VIPTGRVIAKRIPTQWSPLLASARRQQRPSLPLMQVLYGMSSRHYLGVTLVRATCWTEPNRPKPRLYGRNDQILRHQ